MSGARVIPPRSFADVADGDCLQLGDFVLTFRFSADVGALESGPAAPVMAGAAPAAPAMVGAAPAAPVMASVAPAAPVVAGAAPAPAPESGPPSQGSIGLSLGLPEAQLFPDRLLEGRVTVCNRGSKPGVQFKLQVEGLDPDCYEIGAGPILFPGAEKDVSFCLMHPRRSRPVAGEHRFIIRATAAEAYPGESAVVSQVIRIMPFYSHKLRVVSG